MPLHRTTMFSLVLLSALVPHLSLGITETTSSSQLNKEKVDAVAAYFQIMRWRRSGEGDELLPESSLVHFLGDDYNSLSSRMTDITEMADELEFYKTQTEVELMPMSVRSSSDIYSLMRETVPKYLGRSGGEGGNCGTWLKPDATIPDENWIFNYMRFSGNKKKETGILMNKYFKNTRTTKQLAKKIRDAARKGKVDSILAEIRRIGADYLAKPESDCLADMADFRALISLEHKLADHVVCSPDHRLLIDSLPLTLEKALQNLHDIVRDGEFLRSIAVDDESWVNMTSRVDHVTQITDNPLSVLSLDFVREWVSGVREVRGCEAGGECEECEEVKKREKLEDSLRKVRSILPENPCSDHSVVELVDAANGFEAIDEFRARDTLLSSIKHIVGVDGIFEVLSTKLDSYFRKPYLGITYSDVPVKHALWWLATHTLPYDSCDDFSSVQTLRHLLELYSEAFYFSHHLVMSRCPLAPPVDTEDSMMMSSQVKSININNMLRTYNYQEVVEQLELTGPNMTATPNSYDLNLWMSFETLSTKELSLEPGDYEVQLYTFTNYDLKDDELATTRREMTFATQLNALFDKCAVCSILYVQINVLTLNDNQFLSYDAGMIYPLPYEKERFGVKIAGLLERDRPALAQCQKSLDLQRPLYMDSVKTVLESRLLKDRDAMDSYLSYLGADGMEITPQMMMESIEVLKTSQDLANAVTMRIQRTGLENKDYRSTYDDFMEFEEKYLGKKAPKPFKIAWENYTINKNCILMLMGIYKLDLDSMEPAIGSCDIPVEEEVEESVRDEKGQPGSDGGAKKSGITKKGGKGKAKKGGGKKNKKKNKKPKKSA